MDRKIMKTILLSWTIYRLFIIIFTGYIAISPLNLIDYTRNQYVVFCNYFVLLLITGIVLIKSIKYSKTNVIICLAILIPTVCTLVYIAFEKPMSIDTYVEWAIKNNIQGDVYEKYYTEHLKYIYYGGMLEMEAIVNFIIELFVVAVVFILAILRKVRFGVFVILFCFLFITFPYTFGSIFNYFNVFFIFLLYYINNNNWHIKND